MQCQKNTLEQYCLGRPMTKVNSRTVKGKPSMVVRTNNPSTPDQRQIRSSGYPHGNLQGNLCATLRPYAFVLTI